MNSQIAIYQYAQGHLASTRVTAHSIREKIEVAVSEGNEVVFDFSGVNATQSFIDELIGVLILKHGPDVIDNLIFKSCSEDVKSIIQFVVDDRADQYIKKHMH